MILKLLENNKFYLPAYEQIVRQNLYKSLLIFTRKVHFLKGIENRFISDVLKNTAGERDPKNLDAYFRLYEFLLTGLGKILGEEKLKAFIDEIFDNLQCYYPITFEIMEEEKGNIAKSALIA